MTREKEINIVASRYIEKNSINGYITISDHKDSFIEGVKWADAHPKSPWISVNKDLPYNHQELLEAKCQTKEVFVKRALGFFDICYMQKIDGKWIWFPYKSIEFWMPIPKLPKE